MVKLFWNTHNQKKPDSENKKIRDLEEEKYGWGFYHKKNSNLWIAEILKKIKYETIKDETNLEKEDILIIIDSSVEDKKTFYAKLNIMCSKIFLFHLGDESSALDLSSIYDSCDYVWRTFCSGKYFNSEKVKCIPIGYKSGVVNKNKKNRKYKWAFTGTPHKTSRHDLLFQFKDIEPFFCHKTQKFDQKIISIDEMSEVLSATEFIPCPNGFFHPETYRVYEALECGCIPIVENAYKYYDRLFPTNPFIKTDMWGEARPILKGWERGQVDQKRNECMTWWNGYKNELQVLIKNKII